MGRLLLILFFAASVNALASEVAVTVDDLPVHGYLAPGDSRVLIARKFIDVLKKHRVPEAYGFINARKVSDEPETLEVLKIWAGAGYPLANHTYSHPDIGERTVVEYEADIKSNEALLTKLQGEYGFFDFKWFRYPFLREGDTLEKRNAVRNFLRQNDYRIAQVTVDFEDWAWNNPYARCLKSDDGKAIKWLKTSYIDGAVSRLDRARSMSRTLFGRDPKHILLLHIGSFDALMLDELLSRYEAAGVKWVALSDVGKDPIYKINPNTTKKAGWTFLDQLMEVRAKPFPRYAPLPLTKLEKTCLD